MNQFKVDHDPYSSSMWFFTGLGPPIHEAARFGKLNLVEFYLRKGADPNIKDYVNKTAVDYAVEKNYKDIEELLKKGVPVESNGQRARPYCKAKQS